MPPPPTIPVLGKSLLPPAFSYPIGAHPISDALLGVPQFGQFTLRYSNRSPLFMMSRPWSALPLFRVTYSNRPVYEPRPGSSSKPQGGEQWAIEVLPVPAEQRLELQKVITEKALPDFRQWLLGSELPTKDVRQTSRICWFALETGLVEWLSEDPESAPS